MEDPGKLNVYMGMDDILTASDIEYKSVPFGNGLVCIGSVTAGDLIEWSEENEDKSKKRVAGLRLIVKSLCDRPFDPKTGQGGNRIGKPEHVEMFAKKAHKSTETLLKQILKLNGMEVKENENTKNA